MTNQLVFNINKYILDYIDNLKDNDNEDKISKTIIFYISKYKDSVNTFLNKDPEYDTKLIKFILFIYLNFNEYKGIQLNVSSNIILKINNRNTYIDDNNKLLTTLMTKFNEELKNPNSEIYQLYNDLNNYISDNSSIIQDNIIYNRILDIYSFKDFNISSDNENEDITSKFKNNYVLDIDELNKYLNNVKEINTEINELNKIIDNEINTNNKTQNKYFKYVYNEKDNEKDNDNIFYLLFNYLYDRYNKNKNRKTISIDRMKLNWENFKNNKKNDTYIFQNKNILIVDFINPNNFEDFQNLIKSDSDNIFLKIQKLKNDKYEYYHVFNKKPIQNIIEKKNNNNITYCQLKNYSLTDFLEKYKKSYNNKINKIMKERFNIFYVIDLLFKKYTQAFIHFIYNKQCKSCEIITCDTNFNLNTNYIKYIKYFVIQYPYKTVNTNNNNVFNRIKNPYDLEETLKNKIFDVKSKYYTIIDKSIHLNFYYFNNVDFYFQFKKIENKDNKNKLKKLYSFFNYETNKDLKKAIKEVFEIENNVEYINFIVNPKFNQNELKKIDEQINKDQKSKYLKYKKKYLLLKNQLNIN
jgi:hypothetical protein